MNKSPAKFIIKANGSLESFSKNKLIKSLQRTGLKEKVCEEIANQVSSEVKEGDKTRTIYRKALRLVREKSALATVHYSLKKAIFELGPEGHHFEAYVARYFQKKQFKTFECCVLQGKYVQHEVDCVAIKEKEKFYSECKFHNRAGTKNDVKVALYVKARWDDLKQGPEGSSLSGYYIFTNTSFTTDALTYSSGTGLRLMGVNAPPARSFLQEIREMKLYPLTSLRSLNKSEKKKLLQKKIILADELNSDNLFKAGFDKQTVDEILEEITIMLKGNI
jgi:hypothetical protein